MSSNNLPRQTSQPASSAGGWQYIKKPAGRGRRSGSGALRLLSARSVRRATDDAEARALFLFFSFCRRVRVGPCLMPRETGCSFLASMAILIAIRQSQLQTFVATKCTFATIVCTSAAASTDLQHLQPQIFCSRKFLQPKKPPKRRAILLRQTYCLSLCQNMCCPTCRLDQNKNKKSRILF